MTEILRVDSELAAQWANEVARREAEAERLREAYGDILRPVLDITATRPSEFSSTFETERYHQGLAGAVEQTIPELIPDEGVTADYLRQFLHEVCGVDKGIISGALSSLMYRGDITLSDDYTWKRQPS